MQEFIRGVISEFIQSFASEAGKAGARSLFSPKSPVAPAGEAEPCDAAQDPWAMTEGFLLALANEEPDTAWTYCDPFLADDPDRLDRVNSLVGAVPPVSWAMRNMHVPEDWREGDWLEWGLIEAVITFPRDDGGFDALPALITMLNSDDGWYLGDVHWQAESEEGDELPPAASVSGWDDGWESSVEEVHIITCAECSAEFTGPAGYGLLQMTCPTCGTLLDVET